MRSTVLLYLFYNLINCNANRNNQKPHIIVILADDVGWNDFGFHGSNQIPTPNIDALGYNGIILDKFYTQHICTPSRAALLTGNYPIRSGMQGTPLNAGENRSLPLNMPTLPEQLKTLGYHTHLVGKWHLGAAYRKVTPTKRGFDSHFGYWNGFVGYFDYFLAQELPDNTTMDGFDLHDKFKPQWALKGRYATELFTEKSLEIIEKHNAEEPLFLMLAHLAGHTGRNGTELGVPSLSDTNRKYSYIENEERRKYADLVNIMDSSVGQLVEKLSNKNMLENSIVLFFSDNGAQTVGMYQNYGSNWPLKGLKFTLLEGGVRGSAVVYSPLFKKRGYVNKKLMHITDWLPTFYSAAGGNVKKLGKIDGINQWPTLVNDVKTPREEILVNIDETLKYSALISDKGHYKLVNGTYNDGVYDQYFGENGRGDKNPAYNTQWVLESKTNVAIQKIRNQKPLDVAIMQSIRSEVDLSWCRAANTPNFVCKELCLFDLFKDPCETTNIIEENPLLARKLKRKLRQYFIGLVPQTNTAVDPNSNPIYYNNTWTPWLDKCYRKALIGEII